MSRQIGFGLHDDIRKLRSSHAALSACVRAAPVCELSESWRALRGGGKAQSPGLSHLATELLGLPLDKSMRLTNWARRPLTRPQVEMGWRGVESSIASSGQPCSNKSFPNSCSILRMSKCCDPSCFSATAKASRSKSTASFIQPLWLRTPA